jgi:hypothetical protein
MLVFFDFLQAPVEPERGAYFGLRCAVDRKKDIPRVL